MQTTLITGGAGYVGSTLTGLLLQNNYQTIVVDNLFFGGEGLLGFWNHPCFKFYRADITNSNQLSPIFKQNRIEAIVHLAAIVGDPACAKQPELAKKVNQTGSENLLTLAQSAGVERFIFASTCSNYGKTADHDSYVNEESSLAPISLYAKLKTDFEKKIIEKTARRTNFCPVVLRFATIYGASPRMRFDLTVNEFTKELALGRKLEVFGQQFWRPYIHVFDIARAVLLALQADRQKIAYQIFNVGDTQENYTKQMIAEKIKTLIPNSQIAFVPKDDDPRDYKVSFEKIKQKLGFAVSKTLIDGIKEIKYLIENKIIVEPDNPKYKNI